MVRKVEPTSNAAAGNFFRPRDVITSIDSIPISNDSKIPFRRGERVPYECYVQTKFPGDTVRVSLLRRPHGDDEATPTEIVADVPVSLSLSSIPAHHNNSPPPYLITSGLVFTELSKPLLDEWRSWNWDVYLSYLTAVSSKYRQHKDDEVVVLSQVLAHKENLGYENYRALHLVEVDGVKIRNLRHLKKMLEEGKGEFVRFEFAPHGRHVVLERAVMEKVTQEVCEDEGIKESYYFSSVDDDDTNGEDSSIDDADTDTEKEGDGVNDDGGCAIDGKGGGDDDNGCNTDGEEAEDKRDVVSVVSPDALDAAQ